MHVSACMHAFKFSRHIGECMHTHDGMARCTAPCATYVLFAVNVRVLAHVRSAAILSEPKISAGVLLELPTHQIGVFLSLMICRENSGDFCQN